MMSYVIQSAQSAQDLSQILHRKLYDRNADFVEEIQRIRTLVPHPPPWRDHVRVTWENWRANPAISLHVIQRYTICRGKRVAQRLVQLSLDELRFILEYLDLNAAIIVELCKFHAIHEDRARMRLLFDRCVDSQRVTLLYHAAEQTLKTFETVLGALKSFAPELVEEILGSDDLPVLEKAAHFVWNSPLEFDAFNELPPVNSKTERFEIVKRIVNEMAVTLTMRACHDRISMTLKRLSNAPHAPDCILEYLKQEQLELSTRLAEQTRQRVLVWVPRLVNILVCKKGA
jgi:hypothetical protein